MKKEIKTKEEFEMALIVIEGYQKIFKKLLKSYEQNLKRYNKHLDKLETLLEKRRTKTNSL